MARPYTKKSDYWEQRKSGAVRQPVIHNHIPALSSPVVGHPIEFRPTPDIDYGSTTPYSTAKVNEMRRAEASNVGGSSTNVRDRQLNSGLPDAGAYQNIMAMGVPFVGVGGNGGNSRDYVGVGGAVDLCYRAWCGISLFRNAVEVLTEFTNQTLYIKSKNKTVETFFNEWFNAAQIWKFKEEFFREYYRSGNVFIYKFDGRFGPAYYKGYQNAYGTKENRVPIRYELLNPSTVYVPNGLTYPYTYVRMLSTYELNRLRNPMTEQDKQVYQSLPQFVKDQIKVSSSYPMGIYIPMDPKRLRYAFYKKQSYEPMAVPMGFPVMADIEWKLSLKKMDMALARTIEHAILLITTGEKVDEYGGGINYNNIARLQSLFTNQTVGRTLVADYSTKAEWLIPDIKEILGPDKYQVVNEDIKDGLASIIVGNGNEKFANAQIKVKIFIERLVEGQKVFLNDFLMPEIVQICDNMGFRDIPTLEFGKVDLQDEAIMGRLYNQLAQLGVLTGEETVEALKTGILPDVEQMATKQAEYKAQRDKGLYMPLVGGAQPGEGQAGGVGGRPAGTGTPKTVTKAPSPMGTRKASVAFSMAAVMENTRRYEALATGIEAELRRKFKVKKSAELTPAQMDVVQTLANGIMVTKPRDKWLESVATAVEKPAKVPGEIVAELAELKREHGIDDWDAAILYNARREAIGEKK